MMLDATTLLERGIKTIGFQIPQRLRSV
jgi:hypothetical protein